MININKDNYEKEVINEEKVVLDFNANWCGPCKMLKPVLEEIEKTNNIKIVSINVDENNELAEEFNITSIPCLVVMENNKEVNRIIGLRSKTDILNIIGEK